ncbi:hypothetical protein ACP4OV_020182 [Aristida adscensionis]
MRGAAVTDTAAELAAGAPDAAAELAAGGDRRGNSPHRGASAGCWRLAAAAIGTTTPSPSSP